MTDIKTPAKIISIHALREESDVMALLWAFQKLYFNPRPPRGGRPPFLPVSDVPSDFNPRPPRGGRLSISLLALWSLLFQSTPSARRATECPAQKADPQAISIHALREEGDETATPSSMAVGLFQSTPSARRATLQCLVTWSSHRYFNPRPPRGGRRSHARSSGL